MATTKKAATTSTTTIETVPSETDILKQQLEELKAQIALLTQAQASQTTTASVAKDDDKKSIPFINLCGGTVVLRGTRVYTIEGQFKKRSFTKNEARMIVNNTSNAITEGLVYIPDADFIAECGLDNVYATILNNKQLEDLLKREPGYVLETYKNASDGQKNIIVQMVEEKLMRGETVDANILRELGKLSKKDLLNFEPLAENKG